MTDYIFDTPDASGGGFIFDDPTYAAGGASSASTQNVPIALNVQAPSVSFTAATAGASVANVPIALVVNNVNVSFTPSIVATPADISIGLAAQSLSANASTLINATNASFVFAVSSPAVTFTSTGSFAVTTLDAPMLLNVAAPSINFNPAVNVPASVQNVVLATSVSSIRAIIPSPASAKRHASARGVSRSISSSNKR